LTVLLSVNTLEWPQFGYRDTSREKAEAILARIESALEYVNEHYSNNHKAGQVCPRLCVLFQTKDPFLYFPAATLGHHALEMYLKSALIANGMTVFDPKKVKLLDVAITLAEGDCAWGHGLIKLAEQLAKRSPDFDLAKQMNRVGYVTMKEPMTVREGLEVFEPFFSELSLSARDESGRWNRF